MEKDLSDLEALNSLVRPDRGLLEVVGALADRVAYLAGPLGPELDPTQKRILEEFSAGWRQRLEGTLGSPEHHWEDAATVAASEPAGKRQAVEAPWPPAPVFTGPPSPWSLPHHPGIDPGPQRGSQQIRSRSIPGGEAPQHRGRCPGRRKQSQLYRAF